MAGVSSSEIESFNSQLQSLIAKTKNDDASRKQLFGMAMGAVAQLETPLEAVWRIIMSPHTPASIMTLMELGVFDKLAGASGTKTANELAKETNSEPLLIIRLLRPLTQVGIVKEVDEEVYEATPTTKALTDPILRGGYTFMFNSATHSLSQMPTYLGQHGYKNVENAPGPFQYAKSTSDDMFPWLIKQPQLMAHFNKFMSGQQMQRGDWFNRLDVNKMILDGASKDADAVLLVDIGGGEGHDVQAFHRAFPNAPGKLILQDLPPVIGNIKQLDAAIERTPYDFFTPQPVKGARTYYLRSIMHDWSNDKCLEILGRVREAMKPGYSKLLLNEFVLPAKNVPLYPALLDINMMCLLNGMERTAKQWHALLDKAGFKILGIHVDPSGEVEGIIEAELK